MIELQIQASCGFGVFFPNSRPREKNSSVLASPAAFQETETVLSTRICISSNQASRDLLEFLCPIVATFVNAESKFFRTQIETAEINVVSWGASCSPRLDQFKTGYSILPRSQRERKSRLAISQTIMSFDLDLYKLFLYLYPENPRKGLDDV